MAEQPQPTKQEVWEACLAWAEFLYDEYMLKKHKQLQSKPPDKKMGVKKRGKR